MSRKRLSVQELCILSVLGAFIYAAKMMLAGLPNIEPVSLSVLVLAVCLGWKGMIPVCIYILLEFITWGIEIWSICYLYIWAVLFTLAYVFRNMPSAVGWACLSGSFGLAFGALCAIPYIFIGGWSFALTWWIAGIPFDVVHCFGNFMFALICMKPMVMIFYKILPGKMLLSKPTILQKQ